MARWIAVWLFPLGLLGAVVLISLSTVFGYALAIVWGFVLFPHGAAYIWRRSAGPERGGVGNGSDDVDAQYWRTDYWRTTVR
jgi:hypothetical protein